MTQKVNQENTQVMSPIGLEILCDGYVIDNTTNDSIC